MNKWLWRVAVGCFCCATLMTFIPTLAYAEVIEVGGIKFPLSQGMMFLAIGAAWGDFRSWRTQVDVRLKKLEG